MEHTDIVRSTPPRKTSEISIVHNIKKVYATIYTIGTKLPKQHKLGIHSDIEHLVLETITIIIKASLSPKIKKGGLLEEARVNLEVLKHLVRIEYELKIITEKQYISAESQLIEISKMTNGWIKYLTQIPTKNSGDQA